MSKTIIHPSIAAGSQFKNRIINGDMRIDQRNAGATYTYNSNATTYNVDRWRANAETTDGVFTLQRLTASPPTGFTHYMHIQTTTADASIGATQSYLFAQVIEGYSVSDFSMGTSSAKTFSLSFWVRSSLTGTFGGYAGNGAADRTYVFSYVISSANTWEYKTIKIAGDTTGTWLTDSGRGMDIGFSLGTGTTYQTTGGSWLAGVYVTVTGETQLIGTLNATLDITGVQLELGVAATPFEFLPIQTQLLACQRYAVAWSVVSDTIGSGYAISSVLVRVYCAYPIEMRAAPNVICSTPSNIVLMGTGTNPSAVSLAAAGTKGCIVGFMTTGATANLPVVAYVNNTNVGFVLYAEL